MARKVIQETKNYRLFVRSEDNRQTDLKKHKKLMESMQKYGFIKSYPIIVNRNDKGQLVVKDGQHRLLCAETIGLAVSFVEDDVDFDIAEINCTSRVWVLRDFAEKHANNGVQSFQIGLSFSDAHKLPIGVAFSLLAGTTCFSNIEESFKNGTFKIKDQAWADAVAGIYVPLVDKSPAIKNARFIEACMAVCRVKAFDAARLLANVERCREKLIAYSTRDAYLDMLEEIYNFGRNKLVALKIEAITAMRERNAAKSKAKDSDKKGAA